MGRKLALIIGNGKYNDPALSELKAPTADVRGFAELLRDPDIGAFETVKELIDPVSSEIRLEVARFFSEKKLDDLLLLYFSGHGVLHDDGKLYLAAQDTECKFLLGTAIEAAFVTQMMDQSRSRRQLLILDCCHAGAFARGIKGLKEKVGTGIAFEGNGTGRIVLTASDETQYSWEGDQLLGDAENSLFTHYLIQGLRTGEADRDSDGWVTVDDLYNYVHGQVVNKTSKQTPGKWTYKQQGDIRFAMNPRPMPVELDADLRNAIDHPYSEIRLGAVNVLNNLLSSEHKGTALAARAALEKLINDDSRAVSAAASKALAAIGEAERIAAEEAARKAAEAEAKRREEAEQAKLRETEEAKLREAEEAKLWAAEEAKLRAAEEVKLRAAAETKLRKAEQASLREAEEAKLREAEQAKLRETEDTDRQLALETNRVISGAEKRRKATTAKQREKELIERPLRRGDAAKRRAAGEIRWCEAEGANQPEEEEAKLREVESVNKARIYCILSLFFPLLHIATITCALKANRATRAGRGTPYIVFACVHLAIASIYGCFLVTQEFHHS